ncbi:RTA1 like protein-domain-containing protein [Hypoxylon sp. FL1284]|nr:RTA1 like protein-domain-containing protein [Hypoxylon sp. FL1284]
MKKELGPQVDRNVWPEHTVSLARDKIERISASVCYTMTREYSFVLYDEVSPSRHDMKVPRYDTSSYDSISTQTSRYLPYLLFPSISLRPALTMDGQQLIPFGPKATCTLDLCPVEYSVLQYRPSLGGNIAFIAIFAALLFVHSFLGVRWRSWWFMSCMGVGCIAEILGYVGRVMLFYNPFSFIGFMLQIICIACAPVFYSAAIYVTMTKIVESLDPSLSRIRPKLYYIIFIISDVVSLVLQAVGGATSTTSSGSSQSAIDISLAGLSLQVVSLVIFCGLMADYIIRYARSGGKALASFRLKLFVTFLGVAVLLILARCAYRVAELNEGYEGDLIHDEGLFIGLEGVLIVVAALALCIGHPGFVFLPSEKGLKWVSDTSEEDGYAIER